jgi:hypothetical protein
MGMSFLSSKQFIAIATSVTQDCSKAGCDVQRAEEEKEIRTTFLAG